MRVMVGDLWEVPADWRVIPTNGTVTRDGRLVMGRGVALQAKIRYPGLDHTLGEAVQRHGNHVYWDSERRLVTFPVKHNWWERADLGLILRSAHELCAAPLEGVIALPQVGCGNGQRTWKEVGPILEAVLSDERFLVVVKP